MPTDTFRATAEGMPSTTAAERQDSFPIPFPGQNASDDMATSREMLSSVLFYMEDGKELGSSEVQSLFAVLCAATSTLAVVQLFLDDLECPDQDKQYQAARRLWIRQNAGIAVAS